MLLPDGFRFPVGGGSHCGSMFGNGANKALRWFWRYVQFNDSVPIRIPVPSLPPNDIVLILVAFADFAAEPVLNRKQTEVWKTGRGRSDDDSVANTESDSQFSIFLGNTVVQIEKHFLNLCCPSGQTYWWKCFRFYPLLGISQISKDKEKQFIHHLYGYLCLSVAYSIRVWGIVYLSKALREPPTK